MQTFPASDPAGEHEAILAKLEGLPAVLATIPKGHGVELAELAKELGLPFENDGPGKRSAYHLSKALADYGWHAEEQRRLPGGRRVRLWAPIPPAHI